MINVHSTFKDEVLSGNNNFVASCDITLASGQKLSITHADLWDDGYKWDDATSNSDTFDIGSAIVQRFNLKLNNMYDKFTPYSFVGAIINNVKVALTVSSTTYSLLKGVYTVVDAPSYDGDCISIEALDNMYKFDVAYNSNLTFPATLLEIVQDACRQCNVSLATSAITFAHHDHVISKKPDADTYTYRDVLTWVGQISGHFWKCNNIGQLVAGWYSENTVALSLGSDFTTDVSADMDDVVITCIKVVTEDENGAVVTVQSGTDGYGLVVDGNKLITNENADEIAGMIGQRIIGYRFRPLECTCLQIPFIEAGDKITVSDGKNTYTTYITNMTFSLDDDTSISNGAESASRNSANRLSAATRIYQDVRKLISQNKSEWEKAMEDLGAAIANGGGLFPIKKVLDDGSTIYYLADAPTLETATVLFELNSAGWAVSTDGGKTWNAGLTVDGQMVTKILTSIGVNADWINAGTFKIVDSTGKETFYANADTGEVRLAPKTLTISGKSVKEVADASVDAFIESIYNADVESLQRQIDGQIETYYYNYAPTLNNIPASEWSTDLEKTKHEGDLFYDRTTGYAYRFFKDGTTWKWQLIQDTDITKAIEDAAAAQDTADGKRRVFVATPTPPYDIGDLWVQGSDGDIMVCVNDKSSGSYVSSDWEKSNKYTDDTKANEAIAEIKKLTSLNVRLSNEYQTIATDHNGNYSSFPSVVTTVSVYLGAVNVTSACSITATASSGVTGTWNGSNKTYTVTGLSVDDGYVEFTVVNSTYGLTEKKRFTLSKLRAGTPGLPGSEGQPGTSVTITSKSVQYVASTSGTTTPSSGWQNSVPTVTKGQYLWTKVTVNYSDGNSTTAYSVSYMGTNGTNGTDGKNGTSYYTYVRYSTSSNGANMTTSPSGASYIGVYTGTSSTAPTSASSYTWAKFKGDPGTNGKDGNGINSITYYYAVTTTQTAPSASNITATTMPAMSATNKYLWQKEVIDFTDSSIADKTTVILLAVYGDKGLQGEPGSDGVDGGTWTIEVSSNTIKRGEDGALKPTSITANAYFQKGNSASRTAYTGRFYVYSSTNGSSWTQINSVASGTSVTQSLTNIGSTVYWLKFTLCAAGTNTVIDQQTVQILDDISSLTGAIMLEKLSGGWQGIYQDTSGNYYIDATYIKAGTVKGNYIDAKNISVKKSDNTETFKIDSSGNVRINASALSISGTSVATVNHVAEQISKNTGNLIKCADFSSTNFSTYWDLSGTLTRSQSDPTGGTGAVKLQGTNTDGFISAKYSTNNPVKNAGQYEVRVWLKASTTKTIKISFNRVTYNCALTTAWKQFKFVIPITTPSTSNAQNFTIGGWGSIVSGDIIYAYMPEVRHSYTPADVLNMLTNNGAMDGLYMLNNQLYFKGKYIDVDDLKALNATIGGYTIGTNGIYKGTTSISSTTSGVFLGTTGIRLYKDGDHSFTYNASSGALSLVGATIKLGNGTLQAASSAMAVKYGFHIYNTTDTFTDDSQYFKIFNLTATTGTTLIIGSNNKVFKLSSSSKRYKDHIKDMTVEDAKKILDIPVVWFRYKDGYLDPKSRDVGKEIPGFYAEDVEQSYPEAVIYNDDGTVEDWNYRTLVPAMLKVIQELHLQVEELKGKVSE